MPFHLLREVVTGFLVCKIEAVFVDQHFLLFQPLLPRFLRHIVKNPPTEFPRIGREIEAFGLALEFYALHLACHVMPPQ